MLLKPALKLDPSGTYDVMSNSFVDIVAARDTCVFSSSYFASQSLGHSSIGPFRECFAGDRASVGVNHA